MTYAIEVLQEKAEQQATIYAGASEMLLRELQPGIRVWYERRFNESMQRLKDLERAITMLQEKQKRPREDMTTLQDRGLGEK